MEGVPEWITPQLVISIIGVLTALAVVLVQGGRWIGKVDTEIGGLKEDVGDLKEEVGGLKEEVGGLARLVQDVGSKLGRVLTQNPQLVRPGSPVQLTKKGREAAAALHTDIWAAPHVKALLEESKDLKEYEIYALCLTYVQDNRDIWPRNADEVAYEHGTLVEAMATVLAIVLRDKLLELLGSEPS